MGHDRDKPVIAELERRIALFERGAEVGDCMGPSTGISRQLTFWLLAGVAAWAVLAGLAK